MTEVVKFEKARLEMAVRRAYRNWKSQFQEDFGMETSFSTISGKTLAILAQGKDQTTFYLFDFIMNLEKLGSGFEFSELEPKAKMDVMDRYLFLLDRIRFECMKRLGWLESYPGEGISLVEFIVRYDQLVARLQMQTPALNQRHQGFEKFRHLNDMEKEEFIRKLIPMAIKEIQDLPPVPPNGGVT